MSGGAFLTSSLMIIWEFSRSVIKVCRAPDQAASGWYMGTPVYMQGEKSNMHHTILSLFTHNYRSSRQFGAVGVWGFRRAECLRLQR